MTDHPVNFSIRDTKEEDYDAIVNIRHDLYSGTDSLPIFLSKLLQVHRCFVATIKDNVVSFERNKDYLIFEITILNK